MPSQKPEDGLAFRVAQTRETNGTNQVPAGDTATHLDTVARICKAEVSVEQQRVVSENTWKKLKTSCLAAQT